MTAQLLATIRHSIRPYRLCNDRELLDRFVQQRDEAGFSELLQRHGPMVLAVCRRMLGSSDDADDAFQATFLILVRKARSLRRDEPLANWLCAVAYRASHTLRRSRARRQQYEHAVAAIGESGDSASEARDWLPLFDAALQRLPERFRSAVVLCELQGRSRSEAARILGVNEGTLSSRLARARRLLRRDLGRHGFPLAVGALLAPAFVAEALASTTVRHAAALAAVPSGVLQLMEGVIRDMAQSKIRIGTFLVAAMLATAGLTMAGGGQPGKPPALSETDAPKQPPKPTPPPVTAPKQPVATINGEPITREEYGEYLIRLHGAEKLEAFVNRRIIERACEQKKIKVTEAEVSEEFERELKKLQIDKDRFVKHFLGQHGKTLTEWMEETIRPRLMITKLIGASIKVTDDELRGEFESRFGAKVKCHFVLWPATEMKAAMTQYEAIRANPGSFKQDLVVPPAKWHEAAVPRRMDTAANQKIADAAFALKPGDLSPLIAGPDTIVLLKCVESVAPVEGARFEEEKPALLKAVLERRILADSARYFKALKEEANPKILLK
jgi:RNA polymerase sigma factor (sigma-70 family)